MQGHAAQGGKLAVDRLDGPADGAHPARADGRARPCRPCRRRRHARGLCARVARDGNLGVDEGDGGAEGAVPGTASRSRA